jgi:hypothetical protein
MINLRKNLLIALIGSALLLGSVPAYSAGYGYEEGSGESGMSHRMYMGFSLGDGAYFNYRCDYDGGCRSTIVAPLDFELRLGFQVFQNFYLDLSVNWGVDYYDGYYDEVTYVVGAKPGVRFYFPGLFHRHFYLRAAVPLTYTIDEAENFIVGFLLGFGLEWRFASMGIFAEVNILPYFMEIYPGYYAIPTEARVGLAFMF